MRSGSWTRRVALLCAGLVVIVVLFLGVEPEAFVLTAMMTAPFTLGFRVLLVLVAAGLERILHRRRA